MAEAHAERAAFTATVRTEGGEQVSGTLCFGVWERCRCCVTIVLLIVVR